MQARRFVEAYNRIDSQMRQLVDADRRETFHRVLKAAAQSSPVVRTHEREIAKYGELRNAIVHEEVRPDYIIASPHPEVVERIEAIAALLLDPPKVTAVATPHVKCLNLHDPISRALTWSKTHNISRFPVYEHGRFAGLLAPRCIARWLANTAAGACILIDEVRVEAVLAHDETRGRNVEFLAPEASVFEAVDLFTRFPRKGRPVLEAILVTAHGQRNQQLLGIIRPQDVLGHSEPRDR